MVTSFFTINLRHRSTCGRRAAVRFFFYLSHGLAWLVLGRLIISLYEGGIEKSVLRSACSVGLYQCSIYYINSKRVSVFISEALPGVFGEQGKQGISSGEQGNKGQILRGTGEQRQYWGTGNIRKQIFDFWGTGEQANLFQGNKGAGTPLGGPHQYSNTLIRERFYQLA